MYKYRKDLSKEDQKFYALHARENDNEEKKIRHDFQKKLDKDNEKRREREKELKSKGYKESIFGGWYKESSQKLNYTPEAYECWNTLFTAKVKYDKSTPNTWKLKTPDSVIRNKKGNCHDISYYVDKNLDKFAKKKVDKHILLSLLLFFRDRLHSIYTSCISCVLKNLLLFSSVFFEEEDTLLGVCHSAISFHGMCNFLVDS
jgi:hypothetical protein